MQQQFLQAQKMEAIGTLVGGIAHDFNNMLAGITGNVYLAKSKVDKSSDVAEKLHNIEQISFRAADMVKQLLTFARKDTVSMKEMPLKPFVKESVKLLRATIPENIAIQQDICDEPLIIRGDSTQLHQVLLNLVNNARDAVEGVRHPCINIRLSPFEPDSAFTETHPPFKAGQRYARLTVEDNGCGIPEEQLRHVFEPFFTTKEQGKGTGLGLAMVFGAIKSHQGHVEVESVVGKGTAFHVYLPLLKQAGPADALGTDEDVIHGHGECILLADDEPSVRESMKEVLIKLGYRVHAAEDGRQALEIFTAHRNEIVLCILDVVMPHLGGHELAARLRAVAPDLPIVFMTGYDQSQVLGTRRQLPNSEALTKPVSVVVLSRCLRRMLTKDAASESE
ncbi:MAG: response regulator [Deltaproteobacteria bacterium]|nr:MAG: response regulator [Deltaproteobacteria bacterium]